MNPTGKNGPSLIQENREAGIFRVPRRAFVEEAILEEERRRIFDQCWLYVGHASEIPDKGDFLTRAVGGRELVFNRDTTGVVHGFFNTCPHRGAMVCREKQGKAKFFECLYHGWGFDLSGHLVSLPGEADFAEGFKEDGRGNLMPVPRLEVYRDFYFVNYDANAISLEEYLGAATEYLDIVADQSEAGMEIVGGTQEYSIRANWKLLTENSIDGYHALSTHATYLEYLMGAKGNLADMSIGGKGRDLGHGHAVIEYTAPWGRPIAQWIPNWGEKGRKELEAIKQGLVKRFGQERADRIAHRNRNILIFPNLVINDIMAITVRTYYPMASDNLQVNAWALAPKDENRDFRQRRLFNFLEFLGPGGFATPDDVEALEMCQRGYRNMREAGWNDISKGLKNSEPTQDDELQMRCFWREWDRRMSAQQQSVA